MLRYLGFILFPVLMLAQINEFEKEFMKANQRYLSEKNILVTQRFLFSLDSANAVPFDSGYCYIQKNDKMIYYSFIGEEMFSDGQYLIRVSSAAKFLIVAKSTIPDSSMPGLIFREGFSSFKKVVQIDIDNDVVRWKLSAGGYEVKAADITFSKKESRVLSILAELSPDHPFVIQLNTVKSKAPREVFIKIDYSYSTGVDKNAPQLSDYVKVEYENITLAEKYKNYYLKIIKSNGFTD